MQINFVQGIITYPSVGTQQQFLTFGAGYVSLSTTDGRTDIAFAHGTENYLYTESSAVTNAWGPIPPSTDAWLYWDINLRTAVRTFGFTTVQPIISSSAPASPVEDQHWFDTINKKMMLYHTDAWRVVVRVFAAKINNNNFTPLGSGNILKPFAGTQVGLLFPVVEVGRIIVDDTGKPIRRTNGQFFTSESNIFVQGSPVNSIRLEANVFNGTALEPIAQYQIVKFSQFGMVALSMYDDIQSTAIAVCMENLIQNQTGTLCMQGYIINPAWNWENVGAPLWIHGTIPGLLTIIDPHLLDPINHSTARPPVARVITPTSIFFDQGMGGGGERGAPGPQGDPGIQGDQGPQGDPGIGAGGIVNAIASGAITTGRTVIINSDGTVSMVAETSTPSLPAFGPITPFDISTTMQDSNLSLAYHTANNKVINAFITNTGSNIINLEVGTVTGNTITFGTPNYLPADDGAPGGANTLIYDPVAQKILLVYDQAGGLKAIVGDVVGDVITFGIGTPIGISGTFLSSAYDAASGNVVITYNDGANGMCVVGTISGMTTTWGTPVAFTAAPTATFTTTGYDPIASKIVIAYTDTNNTDFGTAIIGTVAGQTISFGTPVAYNSAASYASQLTYDSVANKWILIYVDGANAYAGTANVGTVSGNTISFGAQSVWGNPDSDFALQYNTASNTTVVMYNDTLNLNSATTTIGTTSGTTISFAAPVALNAVATRNFAGTYDTTDQASVFGFIDITTANGDAVVYRSLINITTNLTSENFLGIAQDTVANAQSVDVGVVSFVDSQQSGLTAAQDYFVTDDGDLTLTNTGVLAGRSLSATKILIKG